MKVQICPECSSTDLAVDSKAELLCRKSGIVIESNRFEEKQYHKPQRTNLRSTKETDKHADIFLARKDLQRKKKEK